MKVTAENIIEWSKPHANRVPGARQTVIETKHLLISIVGGAQGLYGDFVKDFEVAVMNREDSSFVTRYFYPNHYDDVIGYMSKTELEDFLEGFVSKGFQVL